MLIDSSFLYALNDTNDSHHTAAVAFLSSISTRLYIPDVTLPEVAYLLRYRINQAAVLRFLDGIARIEDQLIAVTVTDIRRARMIMANYADADFDLVDCCIMALSERLGITTVCTFDRRDFSIFRPSHCDYLELLP